MDIKSVNVLGYQVQVNVTMFVFLVKHKVLGRTGEQFEDRFAVQPDLRWERGRAERFYAGTTLYERLQQILVQRGGILLWCKEGQRDFACSQESMWRVVLPSRFSSFDVVRAELGRIGMMTPQQWQAEVMPSTAGKPAATPGIQIATA